MPAPDPDLAVIRQMGDPAPAIPVLRELRRALALDVFERRLAAAWADGYRLLAAQREAAICAVLGYRITRDICWGRSFFVDDLVVSASERGAGLGGLLLNHSLTLARDMNCDHLRLCSGLTRLDAHRFYEAHGLSAPSKQFVIALG